MVLLEVNIGVADVQAQFWNDCNGSRLLLLRERPNMAHCFHQKRQTLLDVSLDVATSSHIVESFIIQFRKWVQLVRISIDNTNTVSKHRHCSPLVSFFLQIQILSCFIGSLAILDQCLIPFIALTSIVVFVNLIFQGLQQLIDSHHGLALSLRSWRSCSHLPTKRWLSGMMLLLLVFLVPVDLIFIKLNFLG